MVYFRFHRHNLMLKLLIGIHCEMITVERCVCRTSCLLVLWTNEIRHMHLKTGVTLIEIPDEIQACYNNDFMVQDTHSIEDMNLLYYEH